jgi:hypothetical protein
MRNGVFQLCCDPPRYEFSRRRQRRRMSRTKRKLQPFKTVLPVRLVRRTGNAYCCSQQLNGVSANSRLLFKVHDLWFGLHLFDRKFKTVRRGQVIDLELKTDQVSKCPVQGIIQRLQQRGQRPPRRDSLFC